MSDDAQGTVRPDWYPDPMGRHQHRYWDGRSWTDHVADAGEQSVDAVLDATARLEAVRALSADRGPQATKALIAALQDEDLEVRKAAARALGGRQSPDAVQPLLACLDSDSANLRTYAMQSLVETVAAEAALVSVLATREYQPPDVYFDAIADGIRFGSLKSSERCSRILRLAFRESWQSPKSLALLGLLIEIGDPVGLELAAAVNAGDTTAVSRILGSF
ncbi:MAG: HEAT repeat domain-containing protein [Coriobacteriales bacterium]|nr:HEAT repeat domain-containing protein [Coriobacteriales bacterium]